MKIITVGDLVGRCGLQKLKEVLPNLMKQKNIDFAIVNGENVADGMGITEPMYREILSLGVDCVTMGNHTWAKKDIFNFIKDEKIIRPANYSKKNPGKGYNIYTCKSNGKKVCVINLIGRASMTVLSDNPFTKAKEIIDEVRPNVDIIVVDFHAEATAEKIALCHYLEGSANIIVGTHTHVQTADERVFDNGTAYITDLGMTGPRDSVIGMEIAASIKRFETSLPEKYKVAEGKAIFNACIFEIDDNTNKVTKIERIYM